MLLGGKKEKEILNLLAILVKSQFAPLLPLLPQTQLACQLVHFSSLISIRRQFKHNGYSMK